jgi:serine phosphatase RsbU (regulator of sigma subunit)
MKTPPPFQGDGVVSWAARGRPIAGEAESGDMHVAASFGRGTLLGVIDGLGHGPEAAAAARIAASVLTAEPQLEVLSLIKACHEALRGTRGAVMSLASIDLEREELNWAGVGNVEAILIRADPHRAPHREHVLLRSGVVGYQLPPLRSTELPIYAGDMLIFASDGLSSRFGEEPPARLRPADYADYLLRTYGKGDDDALVLVASYQGST